MPTRFITIANGTTDAHYPQHRDNANAAGIFCDKSQASPNAYVLTYDKNAVDTQVADQDNITAIINGTRNITSGAYKTVVVPLNGTTIHGAVQAWQNPEAGRIAITEVLVAVTTVATAAGALDVGTTASSATTASDNLIDGVDVHSATGEFDNNTDKGSNGKTRQGLAAAKWVTFSDDATGNLTGMLGNAYINYIVE